MMAASQINTACQGPPVEIRARRTGAFMYLALGCVFAGYKVPYSMVLGALISSLLVLAQKDASYLRIHSPAFAIKLLRSHPKTCIFPRLLPDSSPSSGNDRKRQYVMAIAQPANTTDKGCQTTQSPTGYKRRQ